MSDDFIDPIFEDADDTRLPPPPGSAAPAPPPVSPAPAPRSPAARPPEAASAETRMPAAQQPTEEVVQRMAAVSHTPRQAKPDDVVCTSCSAANDNGRTFCERCGSELNVVVAAVIEEPNWWRRFLRRLRRPRGGARGGARSVRRGTRVAYRRGLSIKNQVMRVLGLLGLVGGGMFAASIPPLDGLRDSVLDRVTQETVEVRPDSITVLPAGVGQTRWPASEIADGRSNTAWGTAFDLENTTPTDCGVLSGAAGHLRVTFPDAPIDRVEISIGLPDQSFENTGRPSRIGLVWSDSGACQIATLEDTADEQVIDVDGRRAKSVELWILEAVTDGADDPGLVLISELELFSTN